MIPSDAFPVGEQKPCPMRKAAGFYRLSSVVKKNPQLRIGRGDRLSGRAKIFGQKCQDGWSQVDLFSRSIIERLFSNGLTRASCLRE